MVPETTEGAELVGALGDQKVRIKLWTQGPAGTPGPTVELDAAGLEALIATLAGQRAQMTPEVGRAAPAGEIISVDDPIWQSQPTDTGGVGLLLRHPGLGWLSFHLPEKEVKALGEYLLARLDSTGGNTTHRVQ